MKSLCGPTADEICEEVYHSDELILVSESTAVDQVFCSESDLDGDVSNSGAVPTEQNDCDYTMDTKDVGNVNDIVSDVSAYQIDVVNLNDNSIDASTDFSVNCKRFDIVIP